MLISTKLTPACKLLGNGTAQSPETRLRAGLPRNQNSIGDWSNRLSAGSKWGSHCPLCKVCRQRNGANHSPERSVRLRMWSCISIPQHSFISCHNMDNIVLNDRFVTVWKIEVLSPSKSTFSCGQPRILGIFYQDVKCPETDGLECHQLHLHRNAMLRYGDRLFY